MYYVFPMLDFLQIYLDQFFVFVFILSRLTGLFMTAPILSSRSVPLRIRGLLAVALAMLVTPLYWTMPVQSSENLVLLAVFVGQEIILGMSLGLGMMILFTGLQVAGQTVAQMSALSLTDVLDPTSDNETSVISQLFNVIALSCFLLIGGHRLVVAGLLETFQWMPPGDVHFMGGIITVLTEIAAHSFSLGIRAAAPTVAALLMATIVLGLISRTLPQLNILAVGFGINSIVLIGTLAVTLGSIIWVFQDQVEPTLESILDVLRDRHVSL